MICESLLILIRYAQISSRSSQAGTARNSEGEREVASVRVAVLEAVCHDWDLLLDLLLMLINMTPLFYPIGDLLAWYIIAHECN